MLPPSPHEGLGPTLISKPLILRLLVFPSSPVPPRLPGSPSVSLSTRPADSQHMVPSQAPLPRERELWEPAAGLGMFQ